MNNNFKLTGLTRLSKFGIREDNLVSYQISNEIITKTTRCRNNFKCLTDGGFDLCPIDGQIMEGYCFIRMVNHTNNCNYHISFGDTHICSCPVRNELYKHFKV